MWGNRDWILKREKGMKVGWLESLHDGQDCQDVKVDLKEAIIEEIIMENFPESIKDVSLRFSHWDRPRHNGNKCSPCCIWQRQKKPEVAWGGFKRAPVRPTTPTPGAGGGHDNNEPARNSGEHSNSRALEALVSGRAQLEGLPSLLGLEMVPVLLSFQL